MNNPLTIILDTREPDPHPWTPYFSDGITVERATLETGDVCLAAFPGSVVERKTASDFLGVVGTNRQRFERELQRARYCDRFCVIVEASLTEVITQAVGVHVNAIIGTIAAWTRRYCPIVFADTRELAARLALRWLMQPVAEAERVVRLRRKGTDKVAGGGGSRGYGALPVAYPGHGHLHAPEHEKSGF